MTTSCFYQLNRIVIEKRVEEMLKRDGIEITEDIIKRIYEKMGDNINPDARDVYEKVIKWEKE